MGSFQDSSQSAQPLPAGFSTVRQIWDLPNQTVKDGARMSVIGFVKDFQEPCSTKGTDYKCTLEIMDHSIQHETHGLKVIIFWSPEKMPEKPGPADVLIVRNAKAQMWSGGISLIANFFTQFHVLPSSRVPKTLAAASTIRWLSYPPGKAQPPGISETQYAISAHHSVSEIDLPSDTEFEERTAQSLHKREKFCLLKDVQVDGFYDLLGEVIRVFDCNSESLTMYLSDYTPNSNFYHYAWGGGGESKDNVDDFGYAKPRSRPNKQNDWPGPYGKLTIQLTLWDAHARFVRESVKVGQWVFLSNVKIGFGKHGGCLEGFIRGDRGAFEGKIQVKVMEMSEEPDGNDIRWKSGVRRKLEYEKEKKHQAQAIVDEAKVLKNDRKRGSDDPGKRNSKKRRIERRKAVEGKLAKKLDLNENIQCAFPDQEAVPLVEILKLRSLHLGNQNYGSPFALCKYRANVRVVDYFPHKIEDFVVGHQATEFDMLSDYSGGEDTDLEEDMRIFKSGKGFKKNVWEWRFALQVEDADTKGAKDRIWLMVNNQAAQGLLGLDDDATNLRDDQKLLSDLKEQLFKLWGDLEEQKSATLARQVKAQKVALPSFKTASSVSPPRRRAGDMPKDSDDEDEPPIAKFSNNEPAFVIQEHNGNINSNGDSDAKLLVPRNKAFTCCIKQYGVKVDENDEKANAGKGMRWQRMFALFGTQIL